jgi:hypothetical protein
LTIQGWRDEPVSDIALMATSFVGGSPTTVKQRARDAQEAKMAKPPFTRVGV